MSAQPLRLGPNELLGVTGAGWLFRDRDGVTRTFDHAELDRLLVERKLHRHGEPRDCDVPDGPQPRPRRAREETPAAAGAKRAPQP